MDFVDTFLNATPAWRIIQLQIPLPELAAHLLKGFDCVSFDWVLCECSLSWTTKCSVNIGETGTWATMEVRCSCQLLVQELQLSL